MSGLMMGPCRHMPTGDAFYCIICRPTGKANGDLSAREMSEVVSDVCSRCGLWTDVRKSPDGEFKVLCQRCYNIVWQLMKD